MAIFFLNWKYNGIVAFETRYRMGYATVLVNLVFSLKYRWKSGNRRYIHVMSGS